MSRTRSFLENIVLVAILLVLAQTLLEDLATLLDWQVGARRALLVAGFVFDLFFTIEFLVRAYNATRYRALGDYIWTERGWIDLLASVPLLMLNSGPAMLGLLAGGVSVAGVGGILNVLKVVKAIRIARVLRLLRVLKIFRRIKNADSVMAQRHVATISAMSVSIFVFVLLVLAAGGAIVTVEEMDTTYQRQAVAAVEYIEAERLAEPGRERALARFAETASAVLTVEQGGEVRYSRYDQETFDRFFEASDYAFIESDGVAVYLDLRPINREQAADNLRYFLIIVAIIGVLVFLYSPHFAMTVTDPIHVMRRGMAEPGYSLEVKIPRDYRADDVYQLARLYNRSFLPMKDRENAAKDASEGGTTNLSMGDFSDLFG